MNPTNFSLEFFGNQVPWYGPYIGDDQYEMVLSSALKTWPQSVEYSLFGWIFDEQGVLVAERCLLARGAAGRPVTVELRRHFEDIPPMRGMVGLLLRPADSVANPPLSPETWAFRILSKRGISEIIATDSSTSVNFPERSGRRATFRLFSGALVSDAGWRSVACILNPSANPKYSQTVELRVIALNENGERIEAAGGSVHPFGTKWVDLSDLFGDQLVELLSHTNRRGAYVITSDDAGCFGYHFLYHPATHKFAGDHTRPLMAYIPHAYGATASTTGRRIVRSVASPLRFAALRLLHR